MKISPIISCLVLITALSSCNKTDFNYPAGSVGISKIVYFPSIQINGDKIVAVDEGSDFTDPGATAVLNGNPVQYTVSPQISATTPAGIYVVTYTAANPQGFTASDFRIVVVIPAALLNDNVVLANDFSGTYLRPATGITSTWTKIGPGTYKVENPGGAAAGVGNFVIVENYSGNSITIPSQNSPYFGGVVSSSNENYNPGPPAGYTWIFHAPGYGTGVRTFVKQ